jgi:N-acetylglucosaminyl-diphospho-decaprenol L-rhamnosyltransferase
MVDVVVVSYNSERELDRCLRPLTGAGDITVTVVDNASADGSVMVAQAAGAATVACTVNRGFAAGCNRGASAGDAPVVLFLNPDAQVTAAGVRRLAAVLAGDPRIGAVGPRIVDEEGRLCLSQRRFPRLRATFAQALFVHRLVPRARWVQETVTDESDYDAPQEPDWLSGACLAVRRSDLDHLGGWDEGFFLFREDVDICRRLRDAGLVVRYEPAVTAVHQGGASAAAKTVLPVLADSRVRYARKHHGHAVARLERLGVALHALTHAVAGHDDGGARAGYARVLRNALRPAGAAR